MIEKKLKYELTKNYPCISLAGDHLDAFDGFSM